MRLCLCFVQVNCLVRSCVCRPRFGIVCWSDILGAVKGVMHSVVALLLYGNYKRRILYFNLQHSIIYLQNIYQGIIN